LEELARRLQLTVVGLALELLRLNQRGEEPWHY
jgi:hypothetical protein